MREALLAAAHYTLIAVSDFIGFKERAEGSPGPRKSWTFGEF